MQGREIKFISTANPDPSNIIFNTSCNNNVSSNTDDDASTNTSSKSYSSSPNRVEGCPEGTTITTH
jgi:hypothetical protein